MPPIMFAVESAQSRAPMLSSERLVNCFVERQAPEAKSPSPIFGTPGMTQFADVGSGPIRGRWNFQGLLYVVSGTQLWSVSTAGAGTLIGDGILGQNPVGISDNGVQLCVVNGLGGFIFTLATGVFGPITDPNFFPAFTVTFMDGYFIFDRAGTNEWFISALYDGTTYNGLDFASAEANTDMLVGSAQNLQLLFLFCSEHIEIWYDAGNSNFPFARYAGGVITYGCISPYTIIGQDGALFFLGADKVFYRLQANVPIRVSSHAMETIIAADGDITQARCTTYTQEGHKFILLTLPVSGRTLAFDISTGKWHERESWNANGSSLGIWRGAFAIEIYQRILVGDAFTGQVGALSPMVGPTYTEYGNPIRMLAISATVHHDRKRVFLPLLELDVQPGVGLTTGQGVDPQLMLSLSVDGGKTYRKSQRWRSMGKIGEYARRLRWTRNGNARQWVVMVSITDPVFRCIIAANAQISLGM